MEFRAADFPHLNQPEWEAFQRMAEAQGAEAITTQFLPLGVDEQRSTLARFTQHELAEMRERLVNEQLERRVLSTEKRALEAEVSRHSYQAGVEEAHATQGGRGQVQRD